MNRTPDEDEIFHQACEIDDPEQRRAYLDRVCGDDRMLRASLEELISCSTEADDFLETPAIKGKTPRHALNIGDTIGPYRLTEKIGDGGFGVVYRAHQQQPLKREVAIKMLKPGVDTEAVIRRFRAERQVLASLSHPSIAALYDAGETDVGLPYFVMELVDGDPIDQFCELEAQDLNQRVELVREVCDAVGHAHQKGIVHRDLKPSNILVSRQHGERNIKIIDFGIAKVVEGCEFDLLRTRQPQLMGTPSHMSPEQVAGGEAVDTRADIYSVGALLYQLLTGVSPVEACLQPLDSLADTYRLIQECDPCTPSQWGRRRLNLGPGSQAKEIHKHLPDSRFVRGDLDWIVMKSLRKDPADRYQSASELSSELSRYLDGRPVMAGPPTMTYRLGKWVRRNRIASVAVLLVASSLLTGGIISAVGFRSATIAWNQEIVQRRETESERDRAEQVSELLGQLVGAVHTDQGRPADYTVRELLIEFADSIEGRLDDQPETEATIRRILGRSFWSYGDTDRAIGNTKRALNLRIGIYGENHQLTAQSRVDYALCLLWGSDPISAEEQVRHAIRCLDVRSSPEDSIWAHRVLSGVYAEYGLHDASLLEARTAWQMSTETYGDEHPLSALMHVYAAMAMLQSGDVDAAEIESESAMQQVTAIRPHAHVDVALAQRIRSLVLRRIGSFDEAIRLADDAMQIHNELLGESEPLVSDYLALSQLHRQIRDQQKAESFARQAVEIAERINVHRESLRTNAYQTLAAAIATSDPKACSEALGKAVSIKRELVGDRPELARLLIRYGHSLLRIDQVNDATDCFRDSLRIIETATEEELSRDARPKSNPENFEAVHFAVASYLVDALLASNQIDEAEAVAAHVRAQIEDANYPVSVALAYLLDAKLQLAQGETDAALQNVEKAMDQLANTIGKQTIRMQAALLKARCLTDCGEYADAEQILLSLVRKVNRGGPTMELLRRPTVEQMIGLYQSWRRPARARAWQRRLEVVEGDW